MFWSDKQHQLEGEQVAIDKGIAKRVGQHLLGLYAQYEKFGSIGLRARQETSYWADAEALLKAQRVSGTRDKVALDRAVIEGACIVMEGGSKLAKMAGRVEVASEFDDYVKNLGPALDGSQ